MIEPVAPDAGYILWYQDIGNDDVALVGGKNASLGELNLLADEIDMATPFGFTVTTEAYRRLIADNQLEGALRTLLDTAAM